MINFLNIGNIKLAMNESETAEFNAQKSIIEGYKDQVSWTRIHNGAVGALAGLGIGKVSGVAWNRHKLNNPTYGPWQSGQQPGLMQTNALKDPSIIDAEFREIHYGKLINSNILAAIGAVTGGIGGYLTNTESLNLAEQKILEAQNKMKLIIAGVLQRNGEEAGDPLYYTNLLFQNGIDLKDPKVFERTINSTNFIEQSNMSFASALNVQNNTIAVAKDNSLSENPNTSSENVPTQTPAPSEEQSVWEQWLDEHPTINNYITKIKNIDPLTISATVAGTLLVGWGLYKAAKAWKEYREKKKLIANNKEEL